MRTLISGSIRWKLNATLLAAVGVATLISAGSSALRETQQRFAIKREAAMTVATTFAASLASAVEAGDKRDIAIRLNAIRDIPSIRYAIVLDREGQVLHEMGNGVLLGAPNEAISANQPIDVFTTLRLGTYLVSSPIVRQGTQVGQIAIIADFSELRSAIFQSSLGALGAGAVAAALGIFLTSRMRAGISGSITALTRATERIRRTNDYSHPVERTTDDETGRLVDTFNAMLHEIRSRDAALRRQRDHLAEEVKERTKELEAAKEAAEKANAAKSDFLATMSHEIRTPMNGMLVSAELLASANDLPPRARRQCEVIVSSGQVLLSIINDVLDLSKIEAGRMSLERAECVPAQIIEDVVLLYAEKASADGLEIACRIAPDVPASIVGDPLRLRQILSNLVSNALKFTEAGGVIVGLEAAVEGRMIRFSVQDTGIGIPGDRIDSLFEAFTQADNSTTRRFGGTGIGLTICRRLARAMGGEISVTSDVGKGSTFVLELPVESAGNVLRPVSSPAAKGAVALTIRRGPMREALESVITDLGLTLVGDDDLQSAQLVLAEAGAIPAVSTAGAAPAVLLVPGAGTNPDLNQDYPVLEAPIGGRSTREAIVRALDGGRDSSHALPARTIKKIATDISFAGRHVLAVDDSETNLEVLGEALAWFGVGVTSASSGKVALEALDHKHFDLIFMDGSMPEMDGFETTRRIRASETARGAEPTPIVALTAHVIGVGASDWQEAGFSDYLSKPFTLADIRACLTRWFGDNPVAPAVVSSAKAIGSAPPAHSSPLIDRAILDSIREIGAKGDELVVKVIGLFREHAPPLCRALIAQSKDDAKETARSAHALKSLCRSIGASRLGDVCEAIESAVAVGGVARGKSDGYLSPESPVGEIEALLSATLDELERGARLAA